MDAPLRQAVSAGLLQQALGPDWHRLPPVLQAHHHGGTCTEHGRLDVEFPRALQPLLWVLRRLGALVDRRGRAVATRVDRHRAGGTLHWQRRLHYADGRELRFDSTWQLSPTGCIEEFVNPWLGLELRPFAQGHELRCEGRRYLLRLGRVQVHLPGVLALGHAHIVERAVDDHHYAMDFELRHPWFGRLFRYSGMFEVDPLAARRQ